MAKGKYRVVLMVEGSRVDEVRKRIAQYFPGQEAVVDRVVQPRSRSERLGEAESTFDDAKNIVTELKDEMQEWHDSIPDNLKGGDKAESVQAAIDALEELESNMENVDFSNVEFPGIH